jgi:hypothetical protein
LAEEHPRAAETQTALVRAARLAASRRAGARGQSGAPQAAALASTDALLVADTTASAAGPADDCPFSAAA